MPRKSPIEQQTRWRVCTSCQKPFDRGYSMSGARAAKPQYCSRQCRLGMDWARSIEGMFAFKKNFWSLVNVGQPKDCWPYKGHKDKKGYGHLNIKWASRLAHRMAYAVAHNEDVPSDMLVCHHCDNPPCCNPRHLFVGTQKDNMADCSAKKRTSTRYTVRGQTHPKSKIPQSHVRAIYDSKIPVWKLAEAYGVTPTAIRNIKNGSAWAWLTNARNDAFGA